MPGTDKNALVSSLLAFRSRTMAGNSNPIAAANASRSVAEDANHAASADRTGTGSPLPATNGRKAPAPAFENKTDATGKSSKNTLIADKSLDNPSARKISAFKNKARFMMMRQRENI